MAKKLEQESQVDKRIKEYRLKSVLRYVWLVLSLATITLEILALCKVISFLWGVGTFILASLIKIYVQKDDNNKEQKNTKKD
jgi:uncharacterized membrane protein